MSMSIFPKSESKILELIYKNPGIRLSDLIKKANVSVATANKRLLHLIDSEIIKEEKITGGKRVLLKTYYPNFKSEEGKNIFSLIESEKKHAFFKRNKNLIGPFNQLLRNINKNIKIILVFGSFANFSQSKDSDLDILFLFDKVIDNGELKKEIERSFVTFGHNLSPRIDSISNFKKNLNEGVYYSILKNHVIVKGFLNFVELLGDS